MRDGEVVSPDAKVNPQLSHLILEDVGEEDEGVYVIKRSDTPEDVKHFILMVRDCPIEHHLKYGETYYISLSDISGPVTLEFRPSAVQPNQTSDPMVLLLNQTWVPTEEYTGRLSASERRVSLHTVTGTDEGSYTILDSEGIVRKRTCLNVKDHQNFFHLSYAKTLKIDLILDRSKVKVLYTPHYDQRTLLIVDQGELVEPVDPSLANRLSVDGSMCILERVRYSDSGHFRVTDLQGFTISNVYLEVEAYKLSTLYVVLISLVSLLFFLLCLCLMSCLVKVHRRAERAKAIARIAQEAGKGGGEAFRQRIAIVCLPKSVRRNVFLVVHEAYTRFSEESTTRSQWDSNTDNTEVNIKGLEVSKGGRYHTLSSDKNFLDMSDSGVEFNISGLPLDSDTDVPRTYISHKLLLDSDHHNGCATAAPEAVPSAKQTPNSQPSSSPTLEARAGASPEAGPTGAAPPLEADPSARPVTEVDKVSAPPGAADQSVSSESTAA
ncbi:hypothetical protein AAFF_G00120000 [Aldrovandia affinis]|uniref:Uncharacterized protein n=1 Tax=Aldrovandia affinis TaxID=143900 RepID=A0AAD7RSE0_9TELE|nr:hypothetical protein AAFF_G00120000 [Aldrovandia affinis]